MECTVGKTVCRLELGFVDEIVLTLHGYNYMHEYVIFTNPEQYTYKFFHSIIQTSNLAFLVLRNS